MPIHPAPEMPDFATQADDLRTLILGLTGPAPLPPETPLRDALAHIRGHLRQQPLLHPRLSIFVGTHADALPAETHIHQIRMNNIQNADGLATLCASANADLRVYDLSAAPADLNAEHLVRAMSYGMMAVEPGVDLYAATATGPGMDSRLRGNDDLKLDPLAALMQVGDPHLAALAGLVIATQLAKKPIILEGHAGHAIVTLLHRANPASVGHVALISNDANTPCPTVREAIDPDVPGLTLIQTLRGIITS